MARTTRVRTGARTALDAIQTACRMSHLPGFRPAVLAILGDSNGLSLLNLWDPLCALVDTLVAADDWFNQKDFSPEDDGDEDVTGEI